MYLCCFCVQLQEWSSWITGRKSSFSLFWGGWPISLKIFPDSAPWSRPGVFALEWKIKREKEEDNREIGKGWNQREAETQTDYLPEWDKQEGAYMERIWMTRQLIWPNWFRLSLFELPVCFQANIYLPQSGGLLNFSDKYPTSLHTGLV